MAVDSAGYQSSGASSSPFSRSSLFSATDYDPTQSSLVSGLQAAATYDPTVQSTSTPTSVAGTLGALQGVNTDKGDVASTSQGITSAAAQPVSGLLASSSSSKAAYPSYMAGAQSASQPAIGMQNKLSVSQGTSATNAQATATGSNTAQATQQAATNALTPYSGPQTVSVRTKNGEYAYYTFNQSTGKYEFSSFVGKTGNQLTYVNGVPTSGGLTDAQRAGATLTNVGVGQQIVGIGNDTNSVNTINQLYAPQVSQWAGANQTAAAAQQATQAAAAKQAAQSQALDYMTTHGGALSPEMQAALAGQSAGSNAVYDATKQGIIAAQTAYAQQTANASALSGLQPAAIDTTNVDNTNQQALNSLISQYATSGVGGLASRASANQAATLIGQNQLSHDTAAATQYDTNLSAFGQALQTQNSADVQQTGNQLYTNIQAVTDVAAKLEQQLGQLSAQARQQAQAALDALKTQIEQYRANVQAYGQASKQALDIAKGVFSAAATAAAAVV